MIANVLSTRGIGWILFGVGCALLALGAWLKAGEQ